MLKTILSVSGRPGLFKLLSSGKNMVIVESLAEKKRLPIYARDKVVSLGDIAMYTEEGEVALSEILATIQKKEDGKEISPISKPEDLRKYFAEILPNYDRERVYDSDIKKLISWYNLLVRSGYSFTEQEEEKAEANNEVEAVEEKPAEEPKKKETKKKTTAKPKAKKEDKE